MSAVVTVETVEAGYARVAVDGRDIGSVRRDDATGFWRCRYAWSASAGAPPSGATRREAAETLAAFHLDRIGARS